MDKKQYFFDYFFYKNNYPKYLNNVVARMARFEGVVIGRRTDLNIIMAELNEELERSRAKAPKSEPHLSLNVDTVSDSGQIALHPKKFTDEDVCRLGWKRVKEFMTYDSNLNSWKELKVSSAKSKEKEV